MKRLVIVVGCFLLLMGCDTLRPKKKIKKSVVKKIPFDLSTDGAIPCSQLSDQYCKELWSAENLGNKSFYDGSKILDGKVPSRLISYATYLYYKNLLEYKKKLPKDLKVKISKKLIFARLRKHLEPILNREFAQTEKERSLWIREFNDLVREYERTLSDVVDDRVFAKYPLLKNKLWRAQKDDEKRKYYIEKYDLLNQIMDITYLNNPLWLNIKKLFDMAKKDLLLVLNKLDVSKDVRQEMTKRLSSVQLSLPYRDPRRQGSKSSCASTDNNATYKSKKNTFVICIGKVNTVLSDGSLYGTIAHEIAHSIDPGAYTLEQFKKTKLAQLLAEVYQSNAGMGCREWNNKKERYFIRPKNYFTLPPSLEKITQCLVDRSRLDKINEKSLSYASKRIAEKDMDHTASRKNFTYLSQKKIIKDGAVVPNEVYLKPQEYIARSRSYLKERSITPGYFYYTVLFTQEYKCQKEENKSISDLQAFKKALLVTKELGQVSLENRFAFQGQNSSRLRSYNLSLPADEGFADWLSYKAIEIFLKRYQSIEKRRALILGRHAIFCAPHGLELIAKEKVVEEKKYSRRPHPLQRKRRLRSFTPEIAELVSCQRDREVLKIDQRNCGSIGLRSDK